MRTRQPSVPRSFPLRARVRYTRRLPHRETAENQPSATAICVWKRPTIEMSDSGAVVLGDAFRAVLLDVAGTTTSLGFLKVSRTCRGLQSRSALGGQVKIDGYSRGESGGRPLLGPVGNGSGTNADRRPRWMMDGRFCSVTAARLFQMRGF